MGRPRIPVGGYGEISYRTLGKRKIRAMCQVRDADGRLRQVTREGTSQSDARANLLEAVKRRPAFGSADLTSLSPLSQAADLWLTETERKVTDGHRAPNTARVYKSVVDQHIRPGVGELKLCEATVPRLDAFLAGMRAHHGAGITKTTRTALNGILGLAIRHGALPAPNPMRDVGRIRGDRRRPPRALTGGERADWLTRMEADPKACRDDLPDLTRIMLATGVRIGECLALAFEDSVNVDNKVLHVDYTIVRVTGRGLVRGPTKSTAGVRTLALPGWAVDVLLRRGDELGWAGPVFPAFATRVSWSRVGGGWRDPSNTSRALREARDRAGFSWVTSHVFRKTVATVMDEAGMTAREIADQLGHSRVSMTQDVYLGRKVRGHAAALDDMFG